MTSPSFCTSGHERVYITVFGCEICFAPMHGIEQFSVFSFEAATAFLNFITGSRHVVERLRISWDSINKSKNSAESPVNSFFFEFA
jgi:hypothetical protein